MKTIKEIQKALVSKGYTLKIDGIAGPKTNGALYDFQAINGLEPTLELDKATLDLLFDRNGLAERQHYPPWLDELALYMFKHEVKDNKELRAWLKSDGKTLGDPAKNPWCGDAIETAILNTLPKEKFPGALLANPYWARNWALLGRKSDIALGAIVVLSRPGGGGHVGAAVGYDPIRRRVRIRGGNQSNMVTDAWMDEKRVLAYRCPSTWPHVLPSIPIMNASGKVLSVNEA